MNEQDKQIDELTEPFYPSDEQLVEYLLGSIEFDTRASIEEWLASSELAGDRLTEIAIMICGVDQALQSPHLATENAVTIDASPLRSNRRLRIMVGFAVAAAIGLLAFSVSGFRAEDTETRVAMAWVESLPFADESDIGGMPSDEIVSKAQAVRPEVELDREEFVDNDEFEYVNSEMDFMSDEPPDWLLVAVSEMHQADPMVDQTEDAP
jgi:hypothetical protein